MLYWICFAHKVGDAVDAVLYVGEIYHIGEYSYLDLEFFCMHSATHMVLIEGSVNIVVRLCVHSWVKPGNLPYTAWLQTEDWVHPQ